MQQQQLHFFRTTTLTPMEFWRAMESAKRQEDRVAALFRRWGPLSPSQCLERYTQAGYAAPPLTSIRRAITCLCKSGALRMTEEYVMGAHGSREHLWRPMTVQEMAA